MPKFIRRATLERELDKAALIEHCQVVEDQDALRAQLEANNLVAYFCCTFRDRLHLLPPIENTKLIGR